MDKQHPFHIEDEIMDEVEHEYAFSSETTPEQADAVEQALDEMKQGKSPAHFGLDETFQTAVRLHVSTTDAEMDEAVKHGLEQRLLQQFSHKRADAHMGSGNSYRPSTVWKRLLIPFISVSAIAGVVFSITQFVAFDTLPTNIQELLPLNSPSETTNTLAQKIKARIAKAVQPAGDAPTETNADVKQNGNPASDGTVDGPATTGTAEPNAGNDDGAETGANVSTVLALAGVASDIAEVETLVAEVDASLNDLETIASDIETLNTLETPDAEIDSILQSIPTI